MFHCCFENNTKIFRLCSIDALKIMSRFLDYVPVVL